MHSVPKNGASEGEFHPLDFTATSEFTRVISGFPLAWGDFISARRLRKMNSYLKVVSGGF